MRESGHPPIAPTAVTRCNERHAKMTKKWPSDDCIPSGERHDVAPLGDTMKATTLVEHQHRNLEQLCDAVEGGSAGMRASLLPQLAGDLAAHIAMEEQLFYPAACEPLRAQADLRAGRKVRSRHQMTAMLCRRGVSSRPALSSPRP